MHKTEIVYLCTAKNRKDVFLEVIFYIAYLKVKHTKHRMLFDRFALSTPKLCKNKWILNSTLE